MSASLESKATDLAADIGKLGATALRIKEERDALAEALRDLMPMLDECDCIHSDRDVPLCPCRAARAALAQVQS